ncbi:hypothetical protein SODALDRAFT_362971 [Sodiomyces alkalinus F11]|uniref:Uncharacterized protein n=1 Tax=Sodiomyces alkalinus (strain CBS 110278 / VKM F-3762 / F11) TaxID=1314773 RepID=A0A3N2PNN7_SODAK|nr:hypothetical protein SODALDRAFT_362971 [Sodiomyces alkalinus F11]ROT36109.1 hypothetical protein SODALDRAFT_362971 [Sodiomyces alkalinus F11]
MPKKIKSSFRRTMLMLTLMLMLGSTKQARPGWNGRGGPEASGGGEEPSENQESKDKDEAAGSIYSVPKPLRKAKRNLPRKGKESEERDGIVEVEVEDEEFIG